MTGELIERDIPNTGSPDGSFERVLKRCNPEITPAMLEAAIEAARTLMLPAARAFVAGGQPISEILLAQIRLTFQGIVDGMSARGFFDVAPICQVRLVDGVATVQWHSRGLVER